MVRTVADGGELGPVTAALNGARERLIDRGVRARSACFTSLTPGADLARLASEHDVDLLLVDAPGGLLEDARILALLADAPCDVAVVVGGPSASGGPVLVPFTGAEHDWSAVELGAWLARSGDARAPARRAPTTGSDGRDASRLLASASLAVQRALGVAAEPLLVEPSPDALVAAARGRGRGGRGAHRSLAPRRPGPRPHRARHAGGGPRAARAAGHEARRPRAAPGSDPVHLDDRRLTQRAQGGGGRRTHGAGRLLRHGGEERRRASGRPPGSPGRAGSLEARRPARPRPR